MKREYQKPEIEVINIAMGHLMAASFNWSPVDGSRIGVKEGGDDDWDDEELG